MKDFISVTSYPFQLEKNNRGSDHINYYKQADNNAETALLLTGFML